MIRILMTLDAVGGVWRYAIDLAAALRHEGVETAFLGFGPPPSPSQRREADAVGPLTWARSGDLDWLAPDPAALRPVADVVAQEAQRCGADLLHLNLPSQAADLDGGWPVVVVSHSCVATWFRAVRGTGLPAAWQWQMDLTRRGLMRADLIVAPSRAHAGALERCYDGLRRPVAIHNAVGALDPGARQEPIVVAAGRWWDDGKGGAWLDAAAARTEWPIHLVGPLDGPNGAAFRPRHAVAAGPCSHADTLRRMGSSRLFVSPSLYEPFGLAVAEAAMLGLPLILSDLPVFRELWDDAAWFVPVNDLEALAQAINRLAADPSMQERLGRSARKRALGLSVRRTAQAMAAEYRAVLESRRHPVAREA